MENETSDHQQRELISSFINITVDQTEETAVEFLNATSWNLEDAINLFLNSRRNPNHQTQECRNRQLISSFINIALGQTEETAVQFLDATGWNLEEAIKLFLTAAESNPHHQQEQIRPPAPSIKDTLYGSSMRYTSVGVCPEDVWDSTPEEPSDCKLSALYRPPLDLLFNGSFEDAKATSFREDRWLLVNLQSTTEFASHTLNRDVWSNDVVSQTIGSSFVLWQVYDDTNEGQKISTFYKIDSVPPVILLIDPITGHKMRTWSGMIEAHGFLEDLMPYRDVGPQEHVASLTSNKRIKTEKVCFPSSEADDNVDMSKKEVFF